MNQKVKILVIDDSITYRQILLAVIAKIEDAECVGTAASGQIAIRKVNELQPDLLLLDAVMPEMDGVETLRQIKLLYPAMDAIMLSGFDLSASKEMLRSLQIGALDFMPKPKSKNPEEGIAELVNHLKPLIDLMQIKKHTLRRSRSSYEKTLPQISPKPVALLEHSVKSATSAVRKGKFDLVVIGVSTGGPKALDQLIPKLSHAIPCPILIVQHMPAMFTESLAIKLNEDSALQVCEAKGGEKLTAGCVYLAPGGKHLVLHSQSDGSYTLAVNEQPPINNCRPSVDVLFYSVANVFSGNVLAVIMTGMGRDGTEGVRLLKRNGGKCLVQDQASSVVWGMPGSVFEAGLADEVVSLEQLSHRINKLLL